MEAEFTLLVNGRPVRPEALFADPRDFLGGQLMHRQGTSYHIPTGGAVYFDTGVIEIATPVIEIERGCAPRAGRSLWETIRFVRDGLDQWERKAGKSARLAGFSTHYNVSFDLSRCEQRPRRTVEKLARLLAYILPVPVMLLAANRRSTGIGVRPRGDRIEVTADFTPSSSLMIATATFITGVAREAMCWPSFEIELLRTKNLPVIVGYRPMPHTSRKGWLARFDCYPRNPFTADVGAPDWEVRMGSAASRGEPLMLSLREIAQRIYHQFYRAVARVSDPFTYRLIDSVLAGRAPSLLDLDDRPPGYDDVGRLCRWENLFPDQTLARSRYEQVLIHAIAGRSLWMDGARLRPTGMRGWSEVVFRREGDGARFVYSIDSLLNRLDHWERS
ncbi:MAG TPA: hypothetical protein VF747_05620 [Blastocatellia bacterium]